MENRFLKVSIGSLTLDPFDFELKDTLKQFISSFLFKNFPFWLFCPSVYFDYFINLKSVFLVAIIGYGKWEDTCKIAKELLEIIFEWDNYGK